MTQSCVRPSLLRQRRTQLEKSTDPYLKPSGTARQLAVTKWCHFESQLHYTKPFTIMGIKLQLWVSQLFKFSLPLTFIRNIFLLPSNNVVIYDSISPSVPFSLLCVKTRHFLKAKEKHEKWHRSSFRPSKKMQKES